MKSYKGVAGGLFLIIVAARPQLSGIAYPFIQGLLLIPALVALALLLLSPEGDSGPGRVLKEWAILLPWVLCLWSFASLFWSADAGRGLEESIGFLLNLTVFTLVFVLWREKKTDTKTILPVLWIVLLPVILRGVYQYYFGLERLRLLIKQMDAAGQDVGNLLGIISKGRIFAGFLNSNMLAGFLAIFIPIALDLALTSKTRRGQIAMASLVAGQFWILLLTGSMGGSLAAAMAAGAVLIIRRGIRRRELLWMGGVGIVIIAGLIMVRGFDLSLSPDNSLTQHIGYLKAGLSMAAVKPFLGWGSGSGPGTLMGFVSQGIRPVTDPHNFLVRGWISWGLPGVAILAAFLSLWGTKVVRLLFAEGIRGGPAGYAGFVFASLAFLFHSLMDMDFFVPETALFGWVAMGVCLAYAVKASQEDRGLPPVSPVPGLKVLGGAALALVLPILIYTQAEFTGFRATRDVEEGRLLQSADRFAEARHLVPFNGHFVLEEGRARRAAGQDTEAMVLFKKASDLMPYSPYPFWEMGRLALKQERWADALEYLESALARYPTSPRILLDQAQAYYNLGKYQETIDLLLKVEKYAIFDPEAMAVARKALQVPGSAADQEPMQAH